MPHSDNNPLVRMKWLVDAAMERGIAPEEMRELLVAPKEAEPDWDALPMESYIRLFNWVAERIGDRYLGIHLAREVDLASFGGGTYMIHHSSSLKECCQYLDRYDQTISQGVAIAFIEGARDSRLEYRVFQHASADTTQDMEMAMGMLVCFIRRHLGAQWHPERVHFPHATPAQLEKFHTFFGTEVLFDQPVTAIWINNEDLDAKISNADPYLLEVLRNHVDELQKSILDQNNMISRVCYHIAQSLGSEDCTANTTAERLFMSRRSLTRHLSKLGTSFQELRIQVTAEAAKKALAETNSNISEIALRLGYSETSAFDRSFKNLTGNSPKQYRELARKTHH